MDVQIPHKGPCFDKLPKTLLAIKKRLCLDGKHDMIALNS